jgi:uncharacterized protein YgiM (DUF1202 family)
LKKSFRTFVLAFILLVMTSACNLPSMQPDEKNKTSPIEISITTEPISSSTTPLVILPAVRTVEFTPTDNTGGIITIITPTQTTSPGQAATITSTEDTNCRKGPGVMYEIIGKLMVGQSSEVVAKYQNGKFWLIKNPTNPAQECWVWDQTTSVTGNISNLPEATPPATPEITLELSIYAIISPITYTGDCPVTVELIGNFTINTPAIIAYQWTIGDLLVTSGAATAGSSGTFTSSDQITITSTTTNPVRLKASAPPKTVTTAPIGFSIICN